VLRSGRLSSLTCKHLNKRERLARDKYSSLSKKYVNYGQKNCITLAPDPIVIKLFFSSSLILTDVKLECFPIGFFAIISEQGSSQML
jgi:hypothetical protein